MKQPTLADGQSMLAVRFTVDDNKTSLDDLRKDVRVALATAKATGMSDVECQKLTSLQAMLDAGVVPDKQALIPLPLGGSIGDARFGKSHLDVEGFVSPQGLGALLGGADGQGRTASECLHRYLEVEGQLQGNDPLYTTRGLAAAVGKTLGASLVAKDSGG